LVSNGKVMNVYQILVIYLITGRNNGQKVCFKGNLKRLVCECRGAYMQAPLCAGYLHFVD
jgi:hypothetical protein